MKSFSSPVLIYRLFPQFLEAKWGNLNLNKIAKDLSEALQLSPDEPNPFLDQTFVERWMTFIYTTLGIDYSWGGWMEDRSTLWRGHYQKPGECIHLGIDVNVPADISVSMPVYGTLVHSFLDPDQEGGWGGKLIFQCDGYYLVFGHLKGIDNDIGTKYEPGDIIGVVAEPECNGGWFPHLHVQVMKKYDPNVDGYTAYYPGIENDFPDPVKI